MCKRRLNKMVFIIFRRRILALFCISTMLLSSCASIFGNTSMEVKFDSEPRGARVYIAGKFAGVTPLIAKLSIKPEYEISYIYGQYVREFTISPTSSTPYVVNKMLCTLDIVPGVLLIAPPIIDSASGACRGFHSTYFRAMVEIAVE